MTPSRISILYYFLFIEIVILRNKQKKNKNMKYLYKGKNIETGEVKDEEFNNYDDAEEYTTNN